MEMPAAVFVRGGGATHTMAHERAEAEFTADANRRRAEADAERAISRVPIEHGGGQLFDNPLAPKGSEQLYVDLQFLTRNGDPMYDHGEPVRCLADVTVVDEKTQELCLIVACPRCKQNGVPLDRCQMRIRQTNKKWVLSTKGAGMPIPWHEANDERGNKIIRIYKSAGTVVESEKFSCDQCGWTARVVDNKIRPER